MEDWAEREFERRYPSTVGAHAPLPPTCDVCDGEGEHEVAVGQDSFGVWDTVTIVCEECEDTGEDG